MNLLMCLRIAKVGYIVLCEHSESLEDFILGSFGFYSLRVRRKKSTTRGAPQEIRAIPWGNPALKEGGLR